MIPVTKPFLPPSDEYKKFLDGIWQRNWLTNHGPLVNELELKLKDFLDVEHLLYVSNGTIAIQIAIKALGLQGEVITTPFSYIATTSSLVWEGCRPVFVDIDPLTLNIDHTKIEQAITAETTGILATHVYGNPCEIEALEDIARRFNLKLIFDAAHCFGVKYKGRSVFEFGHISTTSFHATKIFHTIEGGAVFTKDSSTLKKMAYLRNFGHDGPVDFTLAGINAKNSEFHAAMGLCNLKYIEDILSKRKLLASCYDKWFEGREVNRPLINKDSDWNYSYYPIIFGNENQLIQVVSALEKNYIFTRRYFYPSLNNVRYLQNNDKCPFSESISSRVLCLPLYNSLSFEEVDMICRLIIRTLRYM